MTNIKKITRDSVADQVYKQLRDNIRDKKWQPGDKIPSENQLVSLFGVSRASIRTAIQRMVIYRGSFMKLVNDSSNAKLFVCSDIFPHSGKLWVTKHYYNSLPEKVHKDGYHAHSHPIPQSGILLVFRQWYSLLCKVLL